MSSKKISTSTSFRETEVRLLHRMMHGMLIGEPISTYARRPEFSSICNKIQDMKARIEQLSEAS